MFESVFPHSLRPFFFFFLGGEWSGVEWSGVEWSGVEWVICVIHSARFCRNELYGWPHCGSMDNMRNYILRDGEKESFCRHGDAQNFYCMLRGSNVTLRRKIILFIFICES
ncbi:hypothetical protein, unlikely [Trypanosoma brucei gambiense DAL972]|uniref:Uncharacterized protein n=1 Tax=Trypanosoma brucei gambiense (strain MHOM/CI/86/DAL972) TaxID=679716 RepID=C9ZK78_TRYB9|nr:hypothetical protein, unlikely [Trypanosoma brucei gambiense DAL972]CBH09842.1 hypothetical protein, unlikely [Trypanosoma brucei gambiense DAL972]|eukprot:XP_011772135.1 hypothetical protein, unlikely [Trypanosoma brucei gambiense DAL972]